MELLVLAIFIACFVVTFGEKIQFDNYRVYSINVGNYVRELEAYPDGTLSMVEA